MGKFKKLLIILLLVFLTGCTASSQNSESEKENNKVSLNLSQANLIASITDNEKYLNDEYLYKLNTLDDSDKISVIITLKSNGLVDYYNNNHRGYSSLSSYSESKYATNKVDTMIKEQKNCIQNLMDQKYINEVNHTYTTLFNGFSAQTTYGQFKKMQKAGLDVKVTISEAYSEPEYQVASSSSNGTVTNVVNVYETGIFDSSNVDYDGENTAVAILDSGFDIHHTVFQNMPSHPMISLGDVNSILRNTKAYSYDESIKAQDIYVNEKIPFVYDYADKDTDVAPYDSNHGTHVAGIIGGSDEKITGVAINTQLVLMKVFADINSGAVQEDILAALEDAILLGVDAINLSLGTSCGFSRSDDKVYINEVYDKIEAAGISLIVAASNDYSSGYGGENSNTSKASNPDSATVGSPGTYSSTMSVASISGVKSKYVIDGNGYTFFFKDANNSSGDTYDFFEMLFEKAGKNKDNVEIEYVTIPGVGKKVNYTNVNVKGKIALVKRGDTSFEEKAQVAYSQGAIGCIIYNNIAGEIYMNAGSDLKIALASISKDDGEYLASKGTGVLKFDKTYLAGPFMSDFSSWGPVSDLALKPEITAHGGSILSSVPGGGYEEISGTSMACPNLCGVVILVRQALKERYPDKTPTEINVMANQLLMSTGTIVLDEHGNPYSPRKQGAGLGNLENALDTKAYLSVDGSTKTKLELKDDPKETGVYELKFEINNVSNETLKYQLDNFTMTESLSVSDPEYIAEKAYLLDPKTKASVTGEGQIDNDIITVNPNGKVTVTYTIELSLKDKQYLRKSFINGMYVEGFAVLESQNEDKIDLSIPFLAFFGDWTQAPMFDKTFYDVQSEAFNASIDEEDKLKADYYATTPLGTYFYSYYVPLGSFVYDIDETKYDKIPASEEHAAIGLDVETINGITSVYAGLLRNAKKMTTKIINNDTGEQVYEHIKYDNHKAYFSGSIVPGYDIINVTSRELGLQNNTQYTFTMKADLDYGDGGASANLNNTFSFSFYVDYEAPIITDASFYSKYDKSLKDNRYYVDVYVYDNHYAQSIRPFTIINGVLTSLSEYVIPIYSDERGGISKVTVEITDYMDLLQYGTSEDGKFSISNGLGFLVDDYALNQSYTFITLPGTNSTNIAYKEEYYSSFSNATYQYHKDIYVGDTLDLTTMLTSDDPTLDKDPEVQAKYFSSLEWTSSNEDVIKVNKGQIEAMSAGTALITCTAIGTDGYGYSIKLKIKVRNKDVTSASTKLTDVNFTYFQTLKAFADGPETSEIGDSGETFFITEKPYISFYPSEQVQLHYELEPWNLKDYELIWSSTNEKVAKVDENGIVTAIKEGTSTITLKVKVNGKLSTLMASIRVSVKNEFIIEGNTLVGYKGNGGDIVIPDDEGILYIGSYAFSLYTTDYNIKIEEDDYDAAKTPDSNNTILSVVIPGDVKEVRKYAFYNCTALEKVTFLKNKENDSCPFIREYAFAGNKNLKEINLDDVQLIGNHCFENCLSLDNISLTNTYAIGEYAFKDCSSLSSVDITALRNIGKGAFINCTNLQTITSGYFTNLSEEMFKNTGLNEVIIKSDRIPTSCFENCVNLKNVVIERNIIYIGKKAFAECSSLEEVKFNDDVNAEFIYENAFNNCTNLKNIYLPDGNFEFEGNVFNNCNTLTNVIINKNTFITNSLNSIFNDCSALSKFTVDKDNKYYKSEDSLLLSKDGKTIIFAAPNYDYGTYTIPNEIEIISNGAFSSIEKLTTIIVNSNVKKIEPYAFADCEALTKIVLSKSSEIEIEQYAFSGCTQLEEIENIEVINKYSPYVFASTALKQLVLKNVIIEKGAFSNIDTLETINISNCNKIDDYAFANNKQLKEIYIDAKEIGEYSFANCVSLNQLNIENLELIGDYAFQGCSSITTISAPKVYAIGNYAFVDCINLSNISFASLKTIGDYAFSTSVETTGNALVNIEFNDQLQTIGEGAFYLSTTLESIVIGNGLNEIGESAFASCTNLKVISSKGKVAIISEEAFSDDYKLEEVNIEGIEYINDFGFYNCNNLKTISLKDVKEIGVQAFNNCYGLEQLDMPKLIKVNAGAFMNAINLKTINVPTIQEIAEQAFSLIAVEEIKLPNTVTKIATSAFFNNVNQTKFTDLNGSDTVKINDYVTLDQGVLYTLTDNNKYLLSAYPTGKTDKHYEVLFGTVRIDEFAGAYNGFIESIVFPDTLKLLGNNCFYKSIRLNTVEFRSTVAPTLEGTRSPLYTEGDFEYDSTSEIYQLLNKYLQLNGYYPLYYGQFKELIGRATKMNLIIPCNDDVSGYDSILYKLYFKYDSLKVSDYVAMNQKSIDYLDKVSLITKDVKLSDEKIIKDARTAYNLLNQDLTKYGYSKEYLDELYNNLVYAETAWNTMNLNRINKSYSHLIEEINQLGSTFDFNKLAKYYEINETLENVDRNDKKYIDVSNVESFKKGFENYFKNLNEDINTIKDISTLPITTVNKVGIAVVASSLSISLLTIIGIIFKRRLF